MSESVLKTFGDLKVGDLVYGSNGNPTEVLRVYEEHTPATMFEVEMEDGTLFEASGNHLWYVESSIDHSLHRRRLKEGAKAFKNMDPQIKKDLLQIATSEQPMEFALVDAIELVNAHGDNAKTKALVRIAESLGHIVEEVTTYEDLYDGSEIESDSLRLYDAQLFCRQILALVDKRCRKMWPLIVGQVVTTEYLARMMVDVEVPTLRPLNSNKD